MLPRNQIHDAVQEALGRSRVVALVGPRQCGKTTMARQFVRSSSANYFDLEDPVSRALLSEPMTALRPLKGLVVIDEIQRNPELFSILRVLADRDDNPAKFLIVGSASPELIRHSSGSLAGRMETIQLAGLSIQELGSARIDELWVRGGFPLSLLATSDRNSMSWRRNFVQSVIERDLPMLGFDLAPGAMMRFFNMLSHYHGGIWNASEIAGSLSMSKQTVQKYLDLLSGLFMVRVLPPWHENIGKRQVKSPKVYVRDSGVLHSLLGLGNYAQVMTHPKLGASWEGFVLEEVIKSIQPDETYFWATHQGAELDLLLMKDGRRIGFEMKRKDAPRLTPSMKIALDDLKLDELTVFYPGDKEYSLQDIVRVLPIAHLGQSLGSV